VPLALRVHDRVAIEDAQPAQQARARLDEDVIAITLGPVLPRVAAASPAGLAIERHAADVAGPGSSAQALRSAIRPSVRTVRMATIDELVQNLGDMKVLDLANLVKRLEEEWGVSAAAVAAPAAVAKPASWNERASTDETARGSEKDASD